MVLAQKYKKNKIKTRYLSILPHYPQYIFRDPMKKGFYSIIGAQFFSSLADNALLVLAIATLQHMNADAWMIPQIKSFFSLSYVLLAAFVGIFADAYLKGRVMLMTNLIKLFGAGAMLFGLHPFIAYGIVGIGAAAYSPAKYGILTELLPAEDLVKANSWIEGATVLSIIFGTVLGGLLIHPKLSIWLGAQGVANPLSIGLMFVLALYFIASIINAFIPDTGARYPQTSKNIVNIFKQFMRANVVLWKDKQGAISLAVTTLFWGAGASLQFIVLWWAQDGLGLNLAQAAILQGLIGIGVALGAVLVTRKITKLEDAFNVLPWGVGMGILVACMCVFNRAWLPHAWLSSANIMHTYQALAGLLLVVIGVMSGFFVVPMNAVLQHRGHTLLSAGQSIAVQNFNENISILLMLALLSNLRNILPTWQIMLIFGSFVAMLMLCIIKHKNRVLKT